MNQEHVAQPLPARGRSKTYPLLLAKLLVTGGAFAYLFSRQSLAALGEALSSLPASAIAVAVFIQLASLMVGAVRWRSLMAAYGAARLPSLGRLYRIYLVGYFYNTYMPFSVGGDLLRGVVSRTAFTESGATKGVAVVFVERGLGLSAILAMTALAVLLDRGQHFGPGVIAYCVLGLSGVAAVLALAALGPRCSAVVPGRLGQLLGTLPSLSRPGRLGFAAALSLGTQAMAAACGHVLVAAVWPATSLADSFLAMPLSVAASFFPLTVAGIGARDVVLVGLYGLLGVPRAEATATAIAYLGVCLLVAGLGGVVQLLAPLEAPERSRPAGISGGRDESAR